MLASDWAQNQSETSIQMTRGTSLLRAAFQGLPIYPDPIDCPWVFDDVSKELLRDK